MAGNSKIPYAVLSFLPVVCALVLWLLKGFPEAMEIDVMAYYVQMLAIAVTIVGVPLSLKCITPARCGERYGMMCLVRMLLMAVVATGELLLYYCFCTTPTFFYLAVITWLSMYFAFPKPGNACADSTDKPEE